MSTKINESESDLIVPDLSGPDLTALAQLLVAQAGERGLELTGPGGLLTGFTRQVLQTALQVEMADHLGYETGDRAGDGSGNSRNGTTSKTVRTDVGDVRINVPRDRAGTFAPVPERWLVSTRL